MIRPLGRFLALGALLLAAQWLLAGSAPERSFDPTGLDDEEILFREALARGYHENDAIVRRRLARNMRFADPDTARSDAELVEDALGLGMHETDLVVRRRLAQRVRLEARHTARATPPSEAELAAYLERHAARFVQPARTRLFQVFARDAERAGALAERLPDAPRPGGDWRELADPLPLPQEPPSLSDAELARLFGPDFAPGVAGLADGGWHGPVRSSYGLHFVWVRERTPARPAELDQVRSQVREALLAERGDAAEAEALAALRGDQPRNRQTLTR